MVHKNDQTNFVWGSSVRKCHVEGICRKCQCLCVFMKEKPLEVTEITDTIQQGKVPNKLQMKGLIVVPLPWTKALRNKRTVVFVASGCIFPSLPAAIFKWLPSCFCWCGCGCSLPKLDSYQSRHFLKCENESSEELNPLVSQDSQRPVACNLDVKGTANWDTSSSGTGILTDLLSLLNSCFVASVCDKKFQVKLVSVVSGRMVDAKDRFLSVRAESDEAMASHVLSTNDQRTQKDCRKTKAVRGKEVKQ